MTQQATKSVRARNEAIKARNEAIVKRFSTIKIRNPKWRFDAMIDQVSKEFYLSPLTVLRIIKRPVES